MHNISTIWLDIVSLGLPTLKIIRDCLVRGSVRKAP